MKYIINLVNLIYCLKDQVIVGYYSQNKDLMPPEKIPFNKITHLNFAFGNLLFNHSLSLDRADLLSQTVYLAHKNKVKILLSIGGWGGSTYFSSTIKNKSSRLDFILKIAEMIKMYNLDGIDLDYEYPASLGAGNNEIDPKNDAKNLMSLFTEMRKFFGSKILLTLAVPSSPYNDDVGELNDMSELGKAIDFMNIMLYDINGSWTNITASNAPFGYLSGYGAPTSFKQSIVTWNAVGIPNNKIVMGVPFYGRSSTLKNYIKDKNPKIYQEKLKAVPKGDDQDSDTKNYSGVWNWRNLRSQNVLLTPFQPGKNWTRFWDNVSMTPWLYNNFTRSFISYDDPLSLKLKTDFVIYKKLRGLMFWVFEEDNGELIEALQRVKNETIPETFYWT